MAQCQGHFWSAHEIRSFLESLIEHQFGPVLFVAGASRNEHAFVQASEDLRLLGYFRSSRQCRFKFKLLRQQLNLAILNFSEDPPVEHQSPYWREMKNLWGQAARPNSVNAFPPGAGPAQDIGLRHLAAVRIVPGAHANLLVHDQQREGEEGEGEQQEEGEQPAIVPGMDAMMLAVRRHGLQAVIALVQELAQRVAAIEEHLDVIVQQINWPRRRRR